MENAERLVNKTAEIHEFASEVARMITGAQMPEFSSENISVADASKLIGLPATSIRAGIVYGWLPIGMAIHNNKPAKSLSEGSVGSNRSCLEGKGGIMRDIIDSTLIGSLASFLPFWIWDSRADQITGAIALSGVIYIARRWRAWQG